MPEVTPDFSCDLDALKAGAKCLGNLCLGEYDLLAIDLWVRIQTLKAVGGPDYTNDLNGLLQASKKWKGLAELERKALCLYIDILYAQEEGVMEPNIQDAKQQSECYKCLGLDVLKNTCAYLKCAIASFEEVSDRGPQ